jgi:phosphatidate cytidylyltransferase
MAQVFVVLIGSLCYLELASILTNKNGKTFWLWAGQALLVFLSMLVAVSRVPTRSDVLVFFAALFTVFAEDVMALVVGQLLPTPHLPRALGRVSPNKTVGGLLGGILTGVVMGSLLTIGLEMAGVLEVNAPVLTAVFLVPIIAPAGDLYESAMKRQMGVKDSGEILRNWGGVLIGPIEDFLQPQGGFLDRFDSFFPVMIFIAGLELLS